MTPYGAKEMAAAFRIVRRNTLAVAEEIPEDKYGYRATPDIRSIGEMLAHIAASTPGWQEMHSARSTVFEFPAFMEMMARRTERENALRTRPDIVEALHSSGDEFASWLEGLSEEVLQEHVTFPPPVEPSSKSRLEMLLSVKEHEMHHRAQLMLIERLLGIVPHLTRQREAMLSGPAR